MTPPRARHASQLPHFAHAAPPSRRLVLCLDGTSNNAFMQRKRRKEGSTIVRPTNVLKLARAVRPWASDGHEQITYYDAGVGSMGRYAGSSNTALALSDRIFGGLGAGFEQNVEEAVHFLVLNYRAGDEIYVFGFSRGAATAQAVVQFLDWCGGLPRKPDAYYLPALFREFVSRLGTSSGMDAVAAINAHRAASDRPPLQAFHPIAVRFLGVWDTVLALGSRFRAGKKTSTPGWSFYVQSRPPPCVQHARQALSIDERRFDFRPEIWLDRYPHQSLEQRWFPGAHSNIGGGYVNDGLANIALWWMIREAGRHGLDLDPEYTKHYRTYPFGEMHDSYKWYFWIFDAVRWKLGRGMRSLLANPETSNQTLDVNVIHRMHWEPSRENKQQMTKTYRPDNVIRFLAKQPDLNECLRRMGVPPEKRRLPDDVMHQLKANK